MPKILTDSGPIPESNFRNKSGCMWLCKFVHLHNHGLFFQAALLAEDIAEMTLKSAVLTAK